MRSIAIIAVLLNFVCHVAAATDFGHRLDGVLQRHSGKPGFSGSLMVKTESGTYFGSIGRANDSSGLSINSDTQFLIASNSKHFVAVSILKLEEQGLLKTSDQVSRFFPEYPGQNLIGPGGTPVTIENLIMHTSGIPDAYGAPTIKSKLFLSQILFDEIIQAISRQPLQFEPGTKFEYSNTGYLLLGEVIRRVSRSTYSEFISSNFLTPLKLTSTFVGLPPGNSRLALSYETENGQREEFVSKYGIKELHVSDVFVDGNIYTTPSDLLTWLSDLFYTELIISNSSKEKMLKPSSVHNYGYGWLIQKDAKGRQLVEHWGGWLSYLSFISVYPDEQVKVVWLGNEIPNENKMQEFYRAISSAVFGD
jgi:CubicO group peptidase (beta-lactamase class C family)